MVVDQYRQYIQQLLTERAERANKAQRQWTEYEVQTLFDQEHDHYQLLYVGWRGTRRDFGCILHLDIKDGKIWIQHDGTETGIANQLVALGVPRQDIVLAFHEPEVRQFTDFGTGSEVVEDGAKVNFA
jgi:serine/threonine protein kinase